MNQAQMYQYVEKYLKTQECEIIVKDPAYIQTQLTVDVDKDIANRPYYWMFVERTGTEPQPLQLTLIFDQGKIDENIRGENIQFGCWRLHQIFQSAKRFGQFIRLYEEVSSSTSTQGLIPWLFINYKISFICDQKKDILYPLGFNLISGQILPNFDQILNQYQLTPKIPDYHFTLRPIFSLSSAISHIEQHIQNYLDDMDGAWAEESNQRLDEEVELLTSFFTGSKDEQPETLQKRLEEVESYRPVIKVDPINLGLTYLQTNPLSKIR
jgi:hypothetical protein